MFLDLPGIFSSSGGGSGRRELDIPEGGAGDKFRTCDYVAWRICKKNDAAPRCELYWSEEKRDQAVAACARFLRRYGAHLFWRPQALVHDKPATPKDVRDGKAIFSLKGEGKTRLVPGLKLPLDARWLTLKNRPYREVITDLKTGKKIRVTVHRQEGQVVQAEEVHKDGRWRRYYGFVGSNRIARAPAEDIEFPPEEGWAWRKTSDWVALGSGFHARLNVPPLTIEPFENLPPRLQADANLTFRLTVRNSRGLDQAPPAPEKSVRLHLLYSAECVAPQGWLAPKAMRETEWVKVPLKGDAQFKAEKGKRLAPTEEMKLATVDLRKWFDLRKPGFYRLQLLPVQDRPEAGHGVPAEVRFSLAPPQPRPQKAK